MDDAIKNLPGDLKELAEIIGVEKTLLVVERFGGTYIRVPKCDGIIREVRNKKIRSLYDGGDYDIRGLALQFRLTDRQISTILSETDKEISPALLPLFDRNP